MAELEEATPTALFKKHVESGFLTKTLNGTGSQANALDQYGEEFVEYAKTTHRPIADLGVAYGFTSKCLLNAGAQVIANELSGEMLQELEKSVTPEQQSRLKLMPGDVMKLELQNSSLDGVWANRFMHLLKPDQVRVLLKNFYSWLVPGGKICVTIPSQYFDRSTAFLPEYQKRLDAGEEWPGYMGPEHCTADWKEAFPSMDSGLMMDIDTLEHEVKRAGFTVEKCSYMPRVYSNDGGRERVGIIAVKKV